MLSPPAFWSDEAGARAPTARLLAPLGRAYGALTARRIARADPFDPGVPVICVGNATLGGVGKTPFALLLLRLLRGTGRAPHALTRGYGGSERGPHRVKADEARRVGDEALLLRTAAPTWVSRDRPAGARAAAEAGADVIVMDDGHQNPSLVKTLSFLLIDAESLFGNGRVFPAGPLREPPEAAVRRADALVSVGGAPPDSVRALAGAKPLLRADLVLDASSVPKGPLLAFAGIGRPERFFRSLARAGGEVAFSRGFPDHHPYPEAEMAALADEAAAAGARLVTTSKDHVRVPASYRDAVRAVPASMTSPDEGRILALLEAL